MRFDPMPAQESQALGIAYVRATLAGDTEAQRVVVDSLGAVGLVEALAQLVLAGLQATAAARTGVAYEDVGPEAVDDCLAEIQGRYRALLAQDGGSA